MRRDMDLIRKILLEIEISNDDPRGWIELNISGRSPTEVAYHVMLLAQADLIDAIDVSTGGEEGFKWKPKNLTWNGHEFLEAARNDTIWEKARTKVAETTGGLSLEILKGVLVQFAKEAAGLL